MSPTVSLAIDVGGLAADTRVALDGDLVNVLIDASHACDVVMIDDFYGLHWTSTCTYLPCRNNCRRARLLIRSLTCVSIGEAARVDPLLNCTIPRLSCSY